MSKIEVKNVEGKAAGEVELSSDVFGIEPNIPVVHQVVVAYEASLRQGTHSVKNRHEVRTVTRSPAAASSLGVRRAPVVPARVPSALASGSAAASSSGPRSAATPSAPTTRRRSSRCAPSSPASSLTASSCSWTS